MPTFYDARENRIDGPNGLLHFENTGLSQCQRQRFTREQMQFISSLLTACLNFQSLSENPTGVPIL